MQVRINAAKKCCWRVHILSVKRRFLRLFGFRLFCGRFKRCTGMTPKEFVADSHKQKSSSNT
ncbi:MAG: hypothetical protein ACLRWC_11755 [Acutalibacter sp.]